MKDTDEKWRSIVCGDCQGELVRLYLRDERLTMDYRTTAMTFDDSHEWDLSHREWSSGIDVEDELADGSIFLIDTECKCRRRQELVAELVDKARRSKRYRLAI